MPGSCRGPIPQKIAGEVDVLPGQRRRVGEQRSRHGLALVPQVPDGIGQVSRVPVHDSDDHQVQPGCPELLRFLPAVGVAAALGPGRALDKSCNGAGLCGMDNLNTHTATDELLVAPAHPRWEFVSQPIYAAYLNLLEPCGRCYAHSG